MDIIVNREELDDLLYWASCIFSGWHSDEDGKHWSDWDKEVHDKINNFRIKHTYVPPPDEYEEWIDDREMVSSSIRGMMEKNVAFGKVRYRNKRTRVLLAFGAKPKYNS